MKIFRRSTFINFAMRLGEKIEKGGGGAALVVSAE